MTNRLTLVNITKRERERERERERSSGRERDQGDIHFCPMFLLEENICILLLIQGVFSRIWG